MLRFPRAHPSVSPAAFPSPSSRAPARALLATARMAIQIAELFIAAAITRVGIIGARITAVGIIGAGIIGVGIIGVGISSPAAASFQSGLSVAVQGGHDDRILTGTQASDTVAASAGAFGATRLDWDLGTSGPAGRFSLLLTTAGSAFTSGAHPRDSDLRAEAAFHHWMSTSLFVDLRVLGLRFRRDEARVLDLDMIAPTARVALLPARSWLLAFDLSPAWPRYPGRRPLDPFGRPLLPPRTEQDRSLGVSMTLLRETAGGGYAALETGWDHNRANDPLVEYDGPFIGARAAGGPATLRFSAHLAFAARSYLYDSGFRSAGPGPVALSLRRDHLEDRSGIGTSALPADHLLRGWIGRLAAVQSAGDPLSPDPRLCRPAAGAVGESLRGRVHLEWGKPGRNGAGIGVTGHFARNGAFSLSRARRVLRRPGRRIQRLGSHPVPDASDPAGRALGNRCAASGRALALCFRGRWNLGPAVRGAALRGGRLWGRERGSGDPAWPVTDDAQLPSKQMSTATGFPGRDQSAADRHRG